MFCIFEIQNRYVLHINFKHANYDTEESRDHKDLTYHNCFKHDVPC